MALGRMVCCSREPSLQFMASEGDDKREKRKEPRELSAVLTMIEPKPNARSNKVKAKPGLNVPNDEPDKLRKASISVLNEQTGNTQEPDEQLFKMKKPSSNPRELKEVITTEPTVPKEQQEKLRVEPKLKAEQALNVLNGQQEKLCVEPGPMLNPCEDLIAKTNNKRAEPELYVP
eukprot:3854539-Ditylum_brightwellii.AAC.1